MVVVEGTFAIVALGSYAMAAPAYRTDRRQGTSRAVAGECGLRAALPRPVVTLMVHEAALLRSLLLWARARRDGLEEGADALD